MNWNDYLPNRDDSMALVSTEDPKFRAFWPVRITQILGGKTWSLSIVRFKTDEPVIRRKRT